MLSYALLLDTGPVKFDTSLTDPTFSFEARSDTRSTILSYTESTTTTPEHAEHFCPEYPKADATTPSTAASRSAVSSTTMVSFPPISATTRLIQICPSAVFEASSLMCSPTSLDPS